MKSRILLLIGALAVFPTLTGCIGSMVQRANDLTARVTGADDPNNSGFIAESGRFSNAMANGGMALLQGRPVSEAVTPPTAPAAAQALAPVPVAKTVTAPAPAKAKAAAKKPPTSSAVKSVVATPADQQAAKPKKGPVN